MSWCLDSFLRFLIYLRVGHFALRAPSRKILITFNVHVTAKPMQPTVPSLVNFTLTYPSVLHQPASTSKLKIYNNLVSTDNMAPSGTSKSLPELVQALPRELYDEIYDLTFTAEANTTVVLDRKDSNPFPNLLHVDRSSRSVFAKSYYANTTFTFTLWYPGARDLAFVSRWLRGLSAEHVCLVQTLLVKVEMRALDMGNPTAYITEQKKAAFDTMFILAKLIFYKWTRPPAHALRIQTWPGWREAFTSESMTAFARRFDATPVAARMSPAAMNLRGTLDGESV